MNREYLDQYRLNSAALLYRNIFELTNDEILKEVLDRLEILTCSGVIISPGMTFKLDESSSPCLFNEKFINYVKGKGKVYIEYNGIIIPLSSNSFDEEVMNIINKNAIIRISNSIIQAVGTVIFGEDVDIYVKPKMIDYIAEKDYEWNFDHYTKTLEQISEVIDSIAKKLKIGVDIE